MKMSKRERKAYNQGKRAGYNEGYVQGLHDGNPFTALAEAAAEVGRRMVEICSDPDFRQALIEAQHAEDEGLIVEDSERGNENGS